MCEATVTKRLNEFVNTEAASLTVGELNKIKYILREKPYTPRPNSDKGVVNCKHKDLKRFGYGLCKSCHDDFIKISGGVFGGSDPPAFQRAEKERMEKAATEENEGGIGSNEQVAVAKSRKEKRQKRAEEAKNAPPPATAMEAVRRTLERKRLSGLINYDVLDELFDTFPAEKSQKKLRTETVTEKKKEETEEHEIVEDEEA